MRIANKDCDQYVASRQEFRGSNLHGWQVKAGVYVVYSYEWYPIVANVQGQWYVTTDGYSISTKKQISQATRAIDPLKVSHEELKRLIA